MGWDAVLVAAGLLCQTMAVLAQSKTVSTKGSIKGMSYDWMAVTTLVYGTRILVACVYSFSSRIQHQSILRAPLLPAPTVSFVIVAIDMVGMAISMKLVQQLRVHGKSKIANQGYSVGLKTCITGFYLLVPVIILRWYIGKGLLHAVDLVDWFWLCFNIFSCIAFLPQLFMNWFHLCTVGVLPHYDRWQAMGLLLLAVGRSVETMNWAQVPVNWPTWILIIAGIGALLCLETQRYMYSNANYEILGH